MVRSAAARTPVWVKLSALVVLLGIPIWWLADRHDRIVNQDRLAAIASDIAGRQVRVRCPGPLGRVMAPGDTNAGVVYLDADGRVPDETTLRTPTCAALDALAEGRRENQLACAERSTSCGEDVQALAWAVGTLTHEAFHLRGHLDEGVTECYAVQTMARTAERLGATPGQARNLAVLHWETGLPQMPSQYHAPGCANGEALDLRPGDPAWP
jgi:hypothetical protein